MPRHLGSFTYPHPHLGWFMRPKFTARHPVGNTAMTAVMTAAMAVGGGVVTNAAAMVATMAGVVDGLPAVSHGFEQMRVKAAYGQFFTVAFEPKGQTP